MRENGEKEKTKRGSASETTTTTASFACAKFLGSAPLADSEHAVTVSMIGRIRPMYREGFLAAI